MRRSLRHSCCLYFLSCRALCYAPLSLGSTDKTSLIKPKYVQSQKLDLPFSLTPATRPIGECFLGFRGAIRTCIGQGPSYVATAINDAERSRPLWPSRRTTSYATTPWPSHRAKQFSYSRIRAAFTIFSPLICSRKRSGGTAGGTIRTSCQPSFNTPL